MTKNTPSQPATPSQQTQQATDGQAQAQGKKNNKGSQFTKKQNRAGSTFKGSTNKMNGHVFQTYGEQPIRGEFQRTLDELKIYCLTTYIQEAVLLESLFDRLENPVLEPPIKPELSDDGVDNSLKEDILLETL